MELRQALTFVEVLVVVAALGLILLATAALRPSNVGVDARVLAQHLVLSRHLAIIGGARAVATSATCVLDRDARDVPWRPASVVAHPPRGLQFTPDGLPRTCDGGGVGNTTILLEHRGRRAAVIVSSLGRVRWELR